MTDTSEKKGIIVIVDDDRFLADMYSTKFIQKGYAVETFDMVSSALDALRKGLKPSAILFDIVMPGQDGFDFLSVAKSEKLGGNAVFIALTNQSSDADRARAESLGVDAYFIKATLIPSEVVAAVMKEMEKRQ